MSYRTFHLGVSEQSDTGSADKSSGKLGDRSVGQSVGATVTRIAPRTFQPVLMRRDFPNQWAEWCCANFHDSVHLAAAFQVSEKTARLWMAGVNAPQGWAAAAAMQGLIEGAGPFVPDLGVAA